MPTVVKWTKNFILLCMLVCGIYIYVLNGRNPESAQMILQTQLKIIIKGNGRLGKLSIDTLDLSVMNKTAADLKANGKKPGSIHNLLGYCQGRDAEVLFRINYSIH